MAVSFWWLALANVSKLRYYYQLADFITSLYLLLLLNYVLAFNIHMWPQRPLFSER